MDSKCTFELNIKPRKIPQKLFKTKKLEISHLADSISQFQQENEKLKAENKVLRENIERCRRIVLETRQQKQMTGNKTFTTFSTCIVVVLACILSLESISDEKRTSHSDRKLLFEKKNWGVSVYFVVIPLFVVLVCLYKKHFKKKLPILPLSKFS